MIIDATEKFFLKDASGKGAKELYARYLEIRKANSLPICSASITYLEAFVQYPPVECIRVIWHKKGRFLTLKYWGDEYIHLLSLIAAYYVDIGNPKLGVLWAYKAIQTMNYFLPHLSCTARKEVLSGLTACGVIYSYAAVFDRIDPDLLTLDWEWQNTTFYYNDNRLE